MSLDKDLAKLPEKIETIDDYMPQMVKPLGIIEINYNGSGKGKMLYRFGGLKTKKELDEKNNLITNTYLMITQSGIKLTNEEKEYIYIREPTLVTKDMVSIELR